MCTCDQDAAPSCSTPTPERADSSGPLTGVRVLEIGAFIAGPFGTMQLADLGAEVIKIENPDGGDPIREAGPFVAGESTAFMLLNRNKRSLCVDLKSEAGRAVLTELVADADVLVENLRPGVMSRLGFGYADVHELNPRTVYVSASGWGQDGPLASLPGLDIMAQARSGLMSVTGMPDGDPVKVGVPVCDLVCGLYVALGALAALRTRDLTGLGQHVDVSLFEAGVSLAVWEAARYVATGESGQRLGSAHQSMAPYQAIRSSDGWVTVGAVTARTWAAFCTSLGMTDLMTDPRYVDAASRYRHRESLIAAIEQTTSQVATSTLVQTLDDAGVPSAPISPTRDVFQNEHLLARDFFWDAPHASAGTVRQIGSPLHISGTAPVRGNAGPVLGEHGAQILAELGLDPARITALDHAGVVRLGTTALSASEPLGSGRTR